MMECPRCGFSQPEDRFCANCGLDIAAFAAKPKPLMQKIVGRPAFYALLAILSIVVLVQLVKRTEAPSNPRARLIAPEASAPVANTQANTAGTTAPAAPLPPIARKTAPATPPPQAQPQQVARPTMPQAPGAQPQVPTAAVGPTEGSTARAAAPESTAQPPPTARPPVQLDMAFYEMGRESWTVLMNEGKNVGEQSGWRAIAFPSKERVQAALSSSRRLPGQRQMATQPSSTGMLHFPLPVGPQGAPPTGLFLDFSVIKAEGTAMELDFAGQLDFQDTHQKAEFVAAWNPQGALILIGFVPRKALGDGAASMLSNSPLSAMTSPDFMEGQSEVVLVIQGR